jgi:hypothetical protein
MVMVVVVVVIMMMMMMMMMMMIMTIILRNHDADGGVGGDALGGDDIVDSARSRSSSPDSTRAPHPTVMTTFHSSGPGPLLCPLLCPLPWPWRWLRAQARSVRA